TTTTDVWVRTNYRTHAFTYNTPGTKNFHLGDGIHYPNFWVGHSNSSRSFGVASQLENIAPPFTNINYLETGGDDGSGTFIPNGVNNSVPIADDQWYCVEVHINLGTPGHADGVIEMWVTPSGGSATQTLSYTGRPFLSTTP